MYSKIAPILIGLCLLFSTATAQDPPPLPFQGEDVLSLGTVAGDPQAYTGQQVTVDATIDELINARTLEITGEGLFEGGRALVVNPTTHHFDLSLTEG